MKRQRDIAPMVKAVGNVIREHVGKHFRILAVRIDALERASGEQSTDALLALAARIEALEQRKTFEYCGVWSEDSAYACNDFVTHDGSLWHCNRETRARPGTNEDWQLAVKRGRNGR